MTINYQKISKNMLLIGGMFTLSACSLLADNSLNSSDPLKVGITKELNVQRDQLNQPHQWTGALTQLKTSERWLNSFADKTLLKSIDQALAHNFKLKQQALSVEIKKRQLLNAGSQLWPDLSANLSNSRRKTTNISTSTSLDLTLKYEIDLWGKLSANEQLANLAWLSEQANFKQAKQQLVVSIITAWYNAVSTEKLLALNIQRAENTKQNLAIIESGYKQGLNSSLDVYLTRNELNSALARVADYKNSVLKAKRVIENLLGQYPSAEILLSTNLPLITSTLPLGLPSDILQKKPSLQASWYSLLGSDASLAFAHKQRFPSFSLSAAINDQQDSLSHLLSASSLGWSLIGNISAPIFQAGRLRNNEEIARLSLRQKEQAYLDTVYQAFADVENAIVKETSLQQQMLLQTNAGKNAQSAYKLSFEQYQQGLVNYSTVLDAQNRWFDAQSSVIQLQNELITNRANLNLALGGDVVFAPKTSAEMVNK